MSYSFTDLLGHLLCTLCGCTTVLLCSTPGSTAACSPGDIYKRWPTLWTSAYIETQAGFQAHSQAIPFTHSAQWSHERLCSYNMTVYGIDLPQCPHSATGSCWDRWNDSITEHQLYTVQNKPHESKLLRIGRLAMCYMTATMSMRLKSQSQYISLVIYWRDCRRCPWCNIYYCIAPPPQQPIGLSVRVCAAHIHTCMWQVY